MGKRNVYFSNLLDHSILFTYLVNCPKYCPRPPVSQLKSPLYHLRARDLVLVCSVGYFIITFLLFLVYIFENMNILYELITIFAGAILFLVTGLWCIISNYSKKDDEYSDDTMLIVDHSSFLHS
ncbi:hypothetical protein QE152_g38384 [Popillia japonica]|uniref:Uncharacterized protein n=1 Tax=Popillia japonica TaxID=7064 RepID=A0AAW1HYC6_POPJA